MAQTNLTIRIDENIKQDGEILFSQIGMSMTTAVTIFLRTAIREQAIPFPVKPYDDYFTGRRMKRILRSIEQADRGEVVTKTLAELEAMEDE